MSGVLSRIGNEQVEAVRIGGGEQSVVFEHERDLHYTL
jgi:hypothetical protein